MLRKQAKEVSSIVDETEQWDETQVLAMRRAIQLMERTLDAARSQLRVAEQRISAGRS